MTKIKWKLFICFSMILSFCFIALTSPNQTALKAEAKSISQMQSEIDQLKKERQAAKDKASSLGSDIANQTNKQAAVQDQIDSTQRLINALNSQISTLQNNISAETEKIKQQEADIQKGITDLKQRLRVMYISGNTSMASVVLGSDDFFDMLMRMELVNRIAEKDKQMIDNLLELKKEHEEIKAELESQKATLDASKADYAETLKSLNGLYDQSQDIIDSKKKQQAYYNNLSAEQKRQLEAAEEAMNKAIEEERLRQLAANGSIVFDGKFGWPVPGYSYISSYYGWDILNGQKRWHSGIDIAGSNIYGKPIVASAPGKVIIAKNDGGYNGGFGNFVVISHDSTYSTLYAHASSVCVNVGDYVKSGQTIAYIGNTGYSFGSHLHFEVRAGSDRVNPLNYLKS